MRSEQQIVDQTEALATWLLSWRWGQEPETPGVLMRNSQNLKAQGCWEAACHIQDMLTSTDVESAVAEVDDQTQPTLDQAYAMGAKGAPPTEAERLLFEKWMAGHCWSISGTWNGVTYVHKAEAHGDIHPPTMLTRQLWAAWRDRAALANPQ